jgi:hypothetical protein
LKHKSKSLHQHQVRNKTSEDSATGANTIPITRGRNILSDLKLNSKNKMLINKLVFTNPSSSKSSKLKEGKIRILKRNFISEIALIKE